MFHSLSIVAYIVIIAKLIVDTSPSSANLRQSAPICTNLRQSVPICANLRRDLRRDLIRDYLIECDR